MLRELGREVVGPRPAGIDELGLDRGHVGRHRTAFFRDRHDHVQSGEHRLGDPAGALDPGASERVEQDRLDAAGELGREAIAWHIDEAREEPAELVSAHEQSHALALLEAEDAHRGRVQLVLVDLEQLVARERVEDRAEVLPGMRVAGEPRSRHHRVDLAPQEWDVERGRVVRRPRPQPEQLVGTDADLIHVDGSVHRGAGIGLPHSEAGVDAAEGRLGVGSARDAERCAGLGIAVAEEREVVVGHPAQQRRRLRVVRIGQRTRDRERLVTHRLPVIDGGANVAEHPQQVAAERLEQGRVGLAVHLEVHERLTWRRLRPGR